LFEIIKNPDRPMSFIMDENDDFMSEITLSKQ